MPNEEQKNMIRYFGEYAINSLQYQRLKLAKPSQLNDPFEFLPNIVGKVDEAMKKTIIDNFLSGDRFHKFVEALQARKDQEWTPEKIREIALANVEQDEAFPSLIAESIASNLLNSAKKTADEKFSLLCFCDPARLKEHGDILMWSHYGNSHAGFRLHFDTSFLASLNSTPPVRMLTTRVN